MRPANRRVIYLSLLAFPVFAFVAQFSRHYLPTALPEARLSVPRSIASTPTALAAVTIPPTPAATRMRPPRPEQSPRLSTPPATSSELATQALARPQAVAPIQASSVSTRHPAQPTMPPLSVIPAVARAPAVSTFPDAPPHVATSKNWSGYVARHGSYTAVRGSWTVPDVTTSAVVDVVTWVGLGGSTTGDLIQAGTEARTFADHPPRYEAWIELLPGLMRAVPFAIHPGNAISVAITGQGSNRWSIAFTNHSTGQNFQTTETYQSTLSSVEWVVERPSYGGELQKLANFGAIEITNASAERKGQTVSLAQTGAAPLNMVDRTGHVIATISGLGSDGRSFTVTRDE